jgi:Cu-Zn family superoxide dismutase
MIRTLSMWVLAATFVLTGIAAGQDKKQSKHTKAAPVSVALKNAKGDSVGTATLRQTPRGVHIKYDLHGLTPGEHAIHIHQNAKCDAADGFKSAGPHFNPDAKKHGLQNPDGPHAGDMPNFTADAKGNAKGVARDPRVTLQEGAPNSVFANGGTALVIHAKADDLKTDPAGNAGDRIACGTITK